MTNAVRTEMRKCNSITRTADKEIVYYDEFMSVKDNDDLTFLDLLEDTRYNTENEAIANIMYSKFMKNVKDKREIEIIKLLANGYKQKEIAKITGCTQSTVSKKKKCFIEQFNKCI